jgi:2-oxoglutarate ferredoxin oxidoreductase subunit alpha
LKTNYCRIRSIPFASEVIEFIRNQDYSYVVEINRDGQLKQLLTLETPQFCTQLRQVSHLDGLPLSASWIRKEIMCLEGKGYE